MASAAASDGTAGSAEYVAGDDAADHRFRFTAMASPCEIRLAGMARTLANAHAALAIAEVRRIEHKYSRYRPDSIVSRINAAAGSGEPVALDDETSQLLDFAAQLHALSAGLFDITSGVLRRVWDFRAARLPATEAIRAAIAQIGWPRVQRTPGAVALPDAGMELDFGGFGKEYAADRAAALLERDGVVSGIVNLGGDLRVLGPRPDGSAWSIGIQHPRAAGHSIASVQLARGALATSGDYERCFEVDGKRYCHLLNPTTGWSVQGWQSISVVAPLCVAAGAVSSIAMLHEDAAPAFLAAQQVAWLGVDAAGAVVRRGLTG